MLREVAQAFDQMTQKLPGGENLKARPTAIEIAQAQQELLSTFSDWIGTELEEQLIELKLFSSGVSAELA